MPNGLQSDPFVQYLAMESAGVYLAEGDRSPETIAERWAEISDMSAPVVTASAFDQTKRYAAMAGTETGAVP
ncbi:SDR family NAD(P)-dependent oxidoreductase [Streptomyces hirsutus]